jgi:hypothetical protein
MSTTIFSDLHDAQLLAVINEGGGRFTLRFKTDIAKMSDVVLEGTERLRCEDFREGNIVLSATVTSKVIPRESDVRWILGVQEGEETSYIEDLLKDVAKGALSLFEIVPSYGAELRAISRGVRRAG